MVFVKTLKTINEIPIFCNIMVCNHNSKHIFITSSNKVYVIEK